MGSVIMVTKTKVIGWLQLVKNCHVEKNDRVHFSLYLRLFKMSNYDTIPYAFLHFEACPLQNERLKKIKIIYILYIYYIIYNIYIIILTQVI